MEAFQKNKYPINIILSLIAVGVIIYYSICGNSCAYLKGTILGIELQYVGIIYMAILILLNLLKTDSFILLFLSAGIGVEAYLLWFQVAHDKYCPYCLAFGGIIFAQFALNFSLKNKWFNLSSMIVALALFALLFEGSAFPTYF